MEITDINLGFLWEDRGGYILDAPDPFWEKWRADKLKFYDFMKNETVPKIIELMVIGYRDEFPRNYWSSNFLNMKILKTDVVADENGAKTYGKDYMLRSDIIAYINREKITKEGFDYSSEITLAFKEEHDLETPIERALEGKNFTKNPLGSPTIYSVEDSAISQIEITASSFKLIVNDDYYVFRGN